MFELFTNIMLITHDTITECTAYGLSNSAQSNQSLLELNSC